MKRTTKSWNRWGWVAAAWLAAVLGCGSGAGGAEPFSADQLQGKKIAVRVFAGNAAAADRLKTAQSRLEEILADVGAAVLDEDKAKELSDVDKILEDPTAFVTAEFLLEIAEKFKIDGILVAHVSADVVPGLADYFSATAHADLRFLDNATAQVRSYSAPPMGARGAPPSDGLTPDSAEINAVQRAIDSVCDAMGLPLTERIRSKSIDVTLAAPVPLAGGAADFAPPENERALAELATLESQTWRKESPSCTMRAPAGDLAAVGGYIADTDWHRRPERLYGSRLHVVDVATRQTLLQFECSPVEMKTRDEPNTKKILVGMFVGGWRYLCAATGNHVFMWDVETGRNVAKLPLSGEPTGMAYVAGADGNGIALRTARGDWLCRIVRENP